MKVVSRKIPIKMTNLPEAYAWLNLNGSQILCEVTDRVFKLPGIPSSANCTFKVIANELSFFEGRVIFFDFYFSKNPLIGHNVISHANRECFINYNTRFHAVKTFDVIEWIKNFFHELTHLADAASVYSFGHKSQKDKMSAPFIVADIAGEVYLEMTRESK